jgi:hypothetical protein
MRLRISVAVRRARRPESLWLSAVSAFATAILVATMAFAQTFTPRDESPEELPAGPGRDETFYACTACHNFKLVAQQGMNRRQWDESLSWMTEKHGMPPLEGEDRRIVLDYLEKTYPPSTSSQGRGSPNPFLNR